jgi:glutamate-1-semialdehyde 2,1-aminomutase
MSGAKDKALRARAEAVIPGGMYGHQGVGLLPDSYPQFFDRGEGAYLYDVDGKRYLDLMCAYGPNLFGYGHEGIDRAFVRQLAKGDALTGPTELMVTLAEKFVALVSHARWAMFCKNGTDATTMAVMVARAHAKKAAIVRAKGAYHGSAPWCTPRPAGTIAEDRARQIFCDYNDAASLEAAVAEAGDDLAAIIASPVKHDAFIDQAPPEPAYAQRARALCDERDALLIVDDVRAGFRIARDCSWSTIGVAPDLSTWGKCIANGHAISALLGSERARAAAAKIYATGSFWFQAAPMAAGIETLRLIADTDYLERITALGERLRAGLAQRAESYQLGLRQTGPVTMPLFLFDDDADLRKGFFFCEAMLERGFYLHPWHNMFLNAAMNDGDIDALLFAAEQSFEALKAKQDDLPANAKMAFLAAPH